MALACPAEPAPSRLRSAVRSALHDGIRRRESRRGRSAGWAAAPGLAALLLVAWLLAAQPWAGREQAAGGTRVAYHIAGNEHLASTLRTLRNHLDAAPDARIVVVAHHNGIEFLLEEAADPGGQPYAGLVRELHARGVASRVCANTLTRRQIDVKRVLPQAQLVSSGIAEISRLQGREGYAYLRM